MLNSCLRHYNDAYVLAKRTIKVVRQGIVAVNTASTAAADQNNKEVILKSWEPFADCFSEINHAEMYKVKDLEVIRPTVQQ